MLIITETERWRLAHPGALGGFLEVNDIEAVDHSGELDARKKIIEEKIRNKYANFSRQDFLAIPVMEAYQRYYKKFSKTYHVLQQVESIVNKGKNLPTVSPLVDSNFISEVDTLILTAGHDVDYLSGSITLDMSITGDILPRMNGVEKEIIPGDMVMRDERGLCCSILYGQDSRSIIRPQTQRVLFAAYAPPGVPYEDVVYHLNAIFNNIQLFSPTAKIEQLKLITA
ncbi:MAG: phenylalanine--tRNA ligase beta subunit-related protein [Chloroflexota bacterium]